MASTKSKAAAAEQRARAAAQAALRAAQQKAAATGPAKGVVRPQPLPPPPVGTYDSSIDYNAGASERGYGQLADDAQTAFEQGQEDYGLSKGDIATARTRANQDYWTRTHDLERQYGILGHQQADHAAQQGITSAGLLGLSQQRRDANQSHDQTAIDTANTRTAVDLDRAQTGLDLGNARQFGGFNGQQLLNPLNGQPVYGSLLTSLTRAGGENNAFQTASSQQRVAGAQANGYIAPAPVLGPDYLKRAKKVQGYLSAPFAVSGRH